MNNLNRAIEQFRAASCAPRAVKNRILIAAYEIEHSGDVDAMARAIGVMSDHANLPCVAPLLAAAAGALEAAMYGAAA